MTKALWIGPGELVVLDLARAGRIQPGVVLLVLAGVLAALAGDRPVCLGVRAGTDAVIRLAVMPLRHWSVLVLMLDLAVIAGAFWTAGRAGDDRRGKEKRWHGRD